VEAKRLNVFHVLTVHWLSDAWIEPQLRFIDRFMPSDTKVYGSLNGIDRSRWGNFEFADELTGDHAQKLNALAAIATERSKPDDYLVFMDGDAFPIAPIDPTILGGTPLAAVRRDENLGDPQPHPCFCVTTVGFWNDIGGDWRQGYTWTNSLGFRTSDVGGNLLGSLRARRIEWRPLLRTNRVNLHPLWFAIYGDVVYHHGAGFRERLARATLDLRRARVPDWLPLARRLDKTLALQAAMRKRRDHPPESLARDLAMSDEMLDAIRSDADFCARLMGTPNAPRA
jgi:hypothetical protein